MQHNNSLPLQLLVRLNIGKCFKGEQNMITHFRYKPLFENTQIPGWGISFYYKQQYYQAEYRKDGQISWLGEVPADTWDVEKKIHELMLYHVYD